MSFDLRVIIYRRRRFCSTLIQAVSPSLGKIPACRQTFCHVGVFCFFLNLSGGLMCLTDRLLSADKSVYADLISMRLRVVGLRVTTDKSFTREAAAEPEWCSASAAFAVAQTHTQQVFLMCLQNIAYKVPYAKIQNDPRCRIPFRSISVFYL